MKVELRGKTWTISDVLIHPSDGSVGIMSAFAESFELTDENGVKWEWNADDLTDAEYQKIDEVVLAAEDDRIQKLYPNSKED